MSAAKRASRADVEALVDLHAPALGWSTRPTLVNGPCHIQGPGVHVRRNGWHLQDRDGRKHWLGGTLAEAGAAVLLLAKHGAGAPGGQGHDEVSDHEVAGAGVGGDGRVDRQHPVQTAGAQSAGETAAAQVRPGPERAGGALAGDQGEAEVEARGAERPAPQQAPHMMVVRIEMWPHGVQRAARTLAVGTFTLDGTNERGEREYVVTLLKDTRFGGPDLPAPEICPSVADPVTSPHDGLVWKRGRVGGHVPGKRGVWDLLGRGLAALLRDRWGRS